MKKEFQNWDPLRRPRHGIAVIKTWKDILQGFDQPLNHGDSSLDPYDRLIWEIWMPYVRTTIRWISVDATVPP